MAGTWCATSAMLVFAMLVLAALPAPASAELRPVAVKRSLLGTHRWYAQTHRGLDVVGAFLARHEYNDGRTETVEGRKLVRGQVPDRPAVDRSRASEIARRATRADRTAKEPTLAVLPGKSARLVWTVVVKRPSGHERVLVDASDGAVRGIQRLAVDARGSGRVFDPNPVVTLRDQSLTDQDDADYPALAGAYKDVALAHLDGSGFLRGDYATIALPDADAAFSPALSFDFGRSSPFFEQVMSYHHVTRAQEYIQSLGFTDLNDEPQALLPNVLPFDNSFFDGFGDVIAFGTGGVDDAEDADIIWHEYGHAMQFDQFLGLVPPSTDAAALADAAAIGEGFSDYWAVTMSQPVNDGYEVACYGDWNAVPLTATTPHCSRRVDEDVTVADRTGRPHDDGRIWSRALWDINQALGREVSNRIVLEAQFAYSPTTSFSDAATVTVSTAERLYGRSAARVVRDAFSARGIRRHEPPVHPPHPLPALHADVVATLGDPAPGGGRLAGEFEPGGLNRDGTASFNANLLVDGEDIGEGAFLKDDEGLSELARAGGVAPGGGTYGYGTIGQVPLNDPGDVAFAFGLEPLRSPFGMNTGLYRRPAAGGTPRPVVIPDKTPAPAGGSFRGAFEAAINGSDQIAFTAITDTDDGYTPGLGSGAYVAGPGDAISTVAAPGDTAPGGGSFDYAGGPSINAEGDVAFSAHVATDPHLCASGFLDCAGSVFMRRAATGVTETVARQGAPVPGDPDSIFFFALEPLVNDRGDVVFFANRLPSFENAIFLRQDGTTQEIVREFQTVPGVGTVAVEFPTFRGFAPDYAINNRGQVAFEALVFGEEIGPEYVRALCIWRAGKITLLARPGTPVRGIGTIARIDSGGILLNDRGEVLLQALLTDGRRVLLRTR